jgi:hypothetical protein
MLKNALYSLFISALCLLLGKYIAAYKAPLNLMATLPLLDEFRQLKKAQ